MSKTFTPIHSSNPEERFVVEKATMEKPTFIGELSSLNYGLEKLYNEHLASLAKYHFPSLTREMPDELVEGVDFKLGMQRFIDGLDKWVDCGKIEYDGISWQLHQSHRRIIAVPISVKSGEESEDWNKLRDKFFKECTDKEKYPDLVPTVNIAPHDLFEWFKRQFAIPTQSGESMEDVLKKHFLRLIAANPNEGFNPWEKQNPLELQFMYYAMSEWASIKCAEKDREIDELKRDKLYWQLEASAKTETP